MSDDEGINNNVESTPFQAEGTRMSVNNNSVQHSRSNLSMNNNINNEIEEESYETDLTDDQLTELFAAEESADLLHTEDMRNGQWNELKGTKDFKNKFTMTGQPVWKIRQKLADLEGQVSHLTKNKVDVGITSLFIQDQHARIKHQLTIALIANRKGVKEAMVNDNKVGIASLMKERVMFQMIIKDGIPFTKVVINCIIGSDTGKWMIAATNESNKKLATIINNEVSFQPVNQILNQTLTGGDGVVPKNTFDFELGIGDGANTAIKMLTNGGRKATYMEYEKQLTEVNDKHLDFSKMGEAGNLELQCADIRNSIYELKLIGEELSHNPKYDGMLDNLVYFPILLRKLADTSNPSRTHPNFTKNEVEWKMAYRDSYQKNLKADNTPMLMSERQKFLEDSMAGVVNGGIMTKKNQYGEGKGSGGGGSGGGNEGKATPFALNTNIRKPGTTVRYCGKVLRNGFCNRPGCKFTGMTKQEHADRLPCRDFAAKGKCSFGMNCRFAHTGDSYDSSKPCVHRGTNNNTNIDDGAVEESE